MQKSDQQGDWIEGHLAEGAAHEFEHDVDEHQHPHEGADVKAVGGGLSLAA